MATTINHESKINTTISGGGYTLDLTSLAGFDGTGLRIQRISVANPAGSTGNVTIATGATNGYALPASIVVYPGGNFVESYNDGGGQDVDATHKTLDVSGTNGDTPIIALSLS